MSNWRGRVAVAVALLAFAAACGDDGGGEDAAAEPAGAEPAAPEGVECVNLPDCPVEISASEGLADGDVVSVRIEGWHPDTSTGVSQCEDAADPDNADLASGPDGLPPAEVCNVLGLTSASQTETSDADGVLAFDYEVRSGASMDGESAGGTCDVDHDCRLEVFLVADVRLRSDAPRVSIPLTFA
jgi:hypothetical protein